MPGRQTIGPQIARHRQKIGKFRPHIAPDAGDRRAPRHVIGRKTLDHALPKRAFMVEHIMRNPQPIGHRPRIANIIARTTRALALHRLAMVIQLQRDADHLGSGLRGKRGDHRRINPARHRHDDSRRF